jgi:hypothetical protein
MTEDWNILYHLGGNGPWIEKLENTVAGGIAAPEGCEVEQVHMMARHAERYPTWKVAISRCFQVYDHERGLIRFRNCKPCEEDA